MKAFHPSLSRLDQTILSSGGKQTWFSLVRFFHAARSGNRTLAPFIGDKILDDSTPGVRMYSSRSWRTGHTEEIAWETGIPVVTAIGAPIQDRAANRPATDVQHEEDVGIVTAEPILPECCSLTGVFQKIRSISIVQECFLDSSTFEAKERLMSFDAFSERTNTASKAEPHSQEGAHRARTYRSNSSASTFMASTTFLGEPFPLVCWSMQPRCRQCRWVPPGS